jgi:hypothetical protein
MRAKRRFWFLIALLTSALMLPPADIAASVWQIAECSDGIDNEGDGTTDYPDDAGCFGTEDDSEESDSGPSSERRPAREVTLRSFRHVRLPEKSRPALRVAVLLESSDDRCVLGAGVRLEMRTGGEWVTLRDEQVRPSGWWKTLVPDRRAPYRVVVPRSRHVSEDYGGIIVCERKSNESRHRHSN